MKILALDGHDAAGKTTLARQLAEAVGARYVRPFGGNSGRKLIEAYEAGRHLETLSIGHQSILSTLESVREGDRIVMDRGWVTVATLVPRHLFAANWVLWVPSTLLWCDEATTRARLLRRDKDENEPDDWHASFLAAYRDRFTLRQGQTLRTDLLAESACLDQLKRVYEAAAPFQVTVHTEN